MPSLNKLDSCLDFGVHFKLQRLAGLEMKPETLWKNGNPPIVAADLKVV